MSRSKNSSEQNNTKIPSVDVMPEYETLERKYQLALEGRLDGWKYKTIAQGLKYEGIEITESTIRKWFMRGGPLELIFKEMKRERAREARKLFKGIRDEYRELMPDAMLTIKKATRQGNLAAALHVAAVNGIVEEEKPMTVIPPRSIRISIIKPSEIVTTEVHDE